MSVLRQWLPAFAGLLYSSILFAQINVSVEIDGVNNVMTDNIRLYLSIEQQKNHPLLSEGRLRRLHKKAPQEISSALKPYGYYKATVTGKLEKITASQWQAIYSVNPGPALPLGLFDFQIQGEIRDDPEFKILQNKFPLREGDTFDHLLYEQVKSSLSKLAAERGYFNARFTTHRVEIDLDSYQAKVYLHYNSGPRFVFAKVLFDQTILDPDLLNRFIPFAEGAPYTLAQVIDLQQALNDSDYFQSVEVSPEFTLADHNRIPINVKLTPRKRHRYTAGLGYGTDTGARAKLGWERPRLNRYGHRLKTEAKVSEIGYSLAAHYRVPILNPRTDQIVYSTGVVNNKTDTSDSTLRTIGARLTRNRGRWRESVALEYQREKFTVADDRGISSLFIPSIGWSRIWGRSFIYTLDGLRFDISLRGASDKLLSDTNFAQLQGGIKGIHPLGSNARFIARGNLGSSWTDEFSELPSSVRFFAGGSQSVRGFRYQSLGPVDDSGKVVGGKHLMTGSIELEHTIVGKWSAATFYDTGNALDDFTEKLERGAGVGLRWQSPVGPVRFDWARALSRDDKPWRIHINIGPDL